jgi:hypothetical protein
MQGTQPKAKEGILGTHLTRAGVRRAPAAHILVAAIAALVLALPGLAQAQASGGIWTSAEELAALPTSGKAWDALLAAAREGITDPNVADQDDPDNVRVLSRDEVIAACRAVIGTQAGGRTLALGRELMAYVVAADLVGLPSDLDASFRSWLDAVRKQTLDGRTLITTHEERPNNWGTHAGASRIAVALYLGDRADLDRAARVFRGWLGDRASYAGFEYGELDWQANPAQPVGINPMGAQLGGHSVDGVLPDDQRRSGAFVWPPTKENYVWEALQGAVAQAVMLERAGYDVWSWSDRALLRAVTWLHTQASFPAEGDDTWTWLVNRTTRRASGADTGAHRKEHGLHRLDPRRVPQRPPPLAWTGSMATERSTSERSGLGLHHASETPSRASTPGGPGMAAATSRHRRGLRKPSGSGRQALRLLKTATIGWRWSRPRLTADGFRCLLRPPDRTRRGLVALSAMGLHRAARPEEGAAALAPPSDRRCDRLEGIQLEPYLPESSGEPDFFFYEGMQLEIGPFDYDYSPRGVPGRTERYRSPASAPTTASRTTPRASPSPSRRSTAPRIRTPPPRSCGTS